MTMIGDKSKFFKNNVFSLNRCCDIVCANDSGHVISHNVAGTKHKNYKNLSELLDEMDLVLQGFVFSDGRLYGAIQDTSSAEIGYWSSKQIGGVTMISLNHLNAQSCLSDKMISIFETMDYMPGLVFIKDLCGKYIYINKYAVSISEFQSSDEIIGLTDKDLWPDSAGVLSKNDCEVIESKQVKKVIEKFTRRNGQVRYYTGFKMPIIQDGKVTALIGNMVDISDVQKKVSEMTDQRDQAIRQNQSKLEFIRNMQHDIRTPFQVWWAWLTSYMSVSSVQRRNLCLRRLYLVLMSCLLTAMISLIMPILKVVSLYCSRGHSICRNSFKLYTI